MHIFFFIAALLCVFLTPDRNAHAGACLTMRTDSEVKSDVDQKWILKPGEKDTRPGCVDNTAKQKQAAVQNTSASEDVSDPVAIKMQTNESYKTRKTFSRYDD